MKVRVIIEPDEDVYVAYCPELPGCVSYGKTEEEAHENIMEAIELYLEEQPEKYEELGLQEPPMFSIIEVTKDAEAASVIR